MRYLCDGYPPAFTMSDYSCNHSVVTLYMEALYTVFTPSGQLKAFKQIENGKSFDILDC